MREWKHQASRESRRLIAKARRERRTEQEQRQSGAEAREAALRAALARRPDPPAEVIERLIHREPESPRAQKMRELLGLLVERSPRLLSPDLLPALRLLAEQDWVRPPSTWRAPVKSRDRLFRSLAEHLLARFRVPPFVWSAFRAGEDAPTLARVVSHVAAGGSLYQAVKEGLWPVPLTRSMCHELLSGVGEPRILDAIRKVQVKAAGATYPLFRAWITTRAGRRLHPRPEEEFWQSVLGWFARNPMPRLTEVAPLVDYIAHRRAEAPAFSMKGRSLRAMLRGMQEWHAQLAKASSVWRRRVFRSCGLEPMDIPHARRDNRGNHVVDVWRFREILDSDALAEEGRAMRHCVLSYAERVEYGECSIWTLTLEDESGHWRRLTIEVRPSQGQIVQARGRFNRAPEGREMLLLEAWASRNRLQVAL